MQWNYIFQVDPHPTESAFSKKKSSFRADVLTKGDILINLIFKISHHNFAALAG